MTLAGKALNNIYPHFQLISDIIQAPAFIRPWLDRFYDLSEIRLLEDMGTGSLDITSFQTTYGFSKDMTDRLLKRKIFIKNQNGDLTPADFHARYDIWALFEGFKDLPKEIRERLNQWELDHYIHTHAKYVNQIKTTGKLDPGIVTPRYLLLDEAYDVLNQVENVYLWPCNCRSMLQACTKPVYTCLRFENSQGQGYEISREKAKEIVGQANKKGLMQSGELARDAAGKLLGAICNCCEDCCFPHRLADELNAQKFWPISFYIAAWDESLCNRCGICAKRCPFKAFIHTKPKDKKAHIAFNESLCRGCGLCSVTCPTNAIEMRKIT